MQLGFEPLENRRSFASSQAVALVFGSPKPSRSVAMPLLHETMPKRRKAPVGQAEWIDAEFRVEDAPVRLWASEDATVAR